MCYRLHLSIALAVCITSAARAQEPYGSIADFKLAKPEDGKDAPSVAAPKDAIALFDGKSLDNWVPRNGKAHTWKLLDGGIVVFLLS